MMPLAFGGHVLYVRKCVTGKQSGADFLSRRVGGVEIPEYSADRSLFVQVVGKGPHVGQRCSKAHARKHGRPRQLFDAVKVGDVLLCPNMHATGIERSPLVDFEFFIEESVPLGIKRAA